MLDLPYVEDSTAEVDMNVVMVESAAGGDAAFVEVQGTAEGQAFTRGELDQLLAPRRARADGDLLAPSRDGRRTAVAASRPRAQVTGSRPRLVCASANPDKVAEMVELLGAAVELVPRPAGLPDVEEDADTLEGNARLKAVAVCRGDG